MRWGSILFTVGMSSLYPSRNIVVMSRDPLTALVLSKMEIGGIYSFSDIARTYAHELKTKVIWFNLKICPRAIQEWKRGNGVCQLSCASNLTGALFFAICMRHCQPIWRRKLRSTSHRAMLILVIETVKCSPSMKTSTHCISLLSRAFASLRLNDRFYILFFIGDFSSWIVLIGGNYVLEKRYQVGQIVFSTVVGIKMESFNFMRIRERCYHLKLSELGHGSGLSEDNIVWCKWKGI